MTVLKANEHARLPITSRANEQTQRFLFPFLGWGGGRGVGLTGNYQHIVFFSLFFPHSLLPEEVVFLPLLQFVPVTFELLLGGDNLSNHNRNKNVMNLRCCEQLQPVC